MKKVLIVSHLFNFINSFLKNDIQILIDNGYEVHCASNMIPNISSVGDIGQLDYLPIVKHQIDFERLPFSISNISAYKQLKLLINSNNFEIIHCHTPIGGILTRLSARISRKKNKTKVIYTAHGFHFYKGAPLINWLLYYPAEKICSYFTDILITINKEDYALAKLKMKAKRVEYMPGIGLDLEKFDNNIPPALNRNSLNIPNDAIVLLSVGELSKRKNHKVIVDSLMSLTNDNIYYLIVGIGALNHYLQEYVSLYNLSNRVLFLGYRNDVSDICKLSDIFCFPSLQEGLPVALMEAMASGLPCIASNIRGNSDLIEDAIGGYLCDPNSSAEFAEAINKLILSSSLRHKMVEHNLKAILPFGIDEITKTLKNIYFLK